MRRWRDGQGKYALSLRGLIGEPPLEKLDEESGYLNQFGEGETRLRISVAMLQLESHQMEDRRVRQGLSPRVQNPVDQNDDVVNEAHERIVDHSPVAGRLARNSEKLFKFGK